MCSSSLSCPRRRYCYRPATSLARCQAEDWQVVAATSQEEISRGNLLTVVPHLGKEWSVRHKFHPYDYSSWDEQGSTCIKQES